MLFYKPNFMFSVVVFCLAISQLAHSISVLTPIGIRGNFLYVLPTEIQNNSLVQRVKTGLARAKLYTSQNVKTTGWLPNTILPLARGQITNNIFCQNGCNLRTAALRGPTNINGLGRCSYGFCIATSDTRCIYNIYGEFWYNCIPKNFENNPQQLSGLNNTLLKSVNPGIDLQQN
ncbi:hypothetical protein BB561_005127 [Smittium simulii]|uniref:Secreted protein n=1 Tax=Smittium simulii TaxID=133385 RepID=A0A2T9YC09_9FUNG|nr:hypothetical protein BB561_005127 [Smittium simulii]